MDRINKRILIITPFATPNIGGVESHIDQLVFEAVRNNYFITLITYQPLTTDTNWEKYSKGKNFEIFRVKWFGIGLFPHLEKFFPASFLYLFPGIFIKSLFFFLKNYKKIDTIHAHGLSAAVVARILKLIHKKNIVLSTHAIYSFNKRKMLGFIIKKVLWDFDYILGVSDVSKKELIALGLPTEKVGTHRNWVDIEKFKPQNINSAKKELGLRDRLNILFVGRFIELKGLKLICESAGNLPNIDFHLVGQGPLSEYILEMSKKYENIVLHGVIRQDKEKELIKLLNLYSSCDYLLSPYLYDEGFSITLLESLCCGTPVIVPKRGSPPTFLPKEQTIFLSKYPTSKEIITTLKKLSENKKVNDEQRHKCREYAVEKFSYKNANLIFDHY